MNVEQFRDFCLSLPLVTEATPFEKFSRGKFTILVFYVAGHMFCYFNIDDFTSVTIKGEPSEIERLKAEYDAIGAPYNGNKKHWMSVTLNSDVDDDKLKTLVSASHTLVCRQYNRHKQK